MMRCMSSRYSDEIRKKRNKDDTPLETGRFLGDARVNEKRGGGDEMRQVNE